MLLSICLHRLRLLRHLRSGLPELLLVHLHFHRVDDTEHKAHLVFASAFDYLHRCQCDNRMQRGIADHLPPDSSVKEIHPPFSDSASVPPNSHLIHMERYPLHHTREMSSAQSGKFIFKLTIWIWRVSNKWLSIPMISEEPMQIYSSCRPASKANEVSAVHSIRKWLGHWVCER